MSLTSLQPEDFLIIHRICRDVQKPLFRNRLLIMVKIGPPSPVVNILDLDEEVTYAGTKTETWQIIKFFLEKLRPVRHADMEPDDSKCDICTEDFTDSHRAVRLPCNHYFGEQCIKKWLSPYTAHSNVWALPEGANTCPKCRREFFPEQNAVDILPAIKTRISLWDKTYGMLGIALSERERQAREDLLLYLDSYSARGKDEYYPSLTINAPYPQWAHQQLLRFSLQLKDKNLTPIQENLRQGLELVATQGFPPGSKWRVDTNGDLCFEVKDIGVDGHKEPDRETKTGGEIKIDEDVQFEETEELAEGDSEEMRFFRALFR